MSFDKKTIAILVLILLLVAGGLFAWYREQNRPVISKTEYVNVPQVKEVVRIKRVEIPVKKVVVLDKKEASKKLALPEEIKKDPARQITASGEIAPYEGKTDVLAVLNTGSGESSIIAKQRPLPLFDFENKKEIGIRYGFSVKASDNYEGAAYGRWDFLRIGNVHLGVYGEVNTTGDAKAQVSAGYRF